MAHPTPRPLTFSEADNALIRQMRADCKGWETIGAVLGIHRDKISAYGVMVLGLPRVLKYRPQSTAMPLTPEKERMLRWGPEPLPPCCGVVDLNAGLKSLQ